MIEKGVRMVQVYYGNGQPWDNHDDIRVHSKLAAKVDSPIAALIEDLKARGLFDETIVIIGSEFGRTPKVNPAGGRDHWPRVNSALLACGGMRHGQVIGATDKIAAEPTDRPVAFGEIFATLYRQLGTDVTKVTLHDHAGRPQYLVDSHLPMPELI